MSIEQGSTGVPEVDPSRPATRVNLYMIAAILLFIVATGIVVATTAMRSHDHRNRPEPDQLQQPVEQMPNNKPVPNEKRPGL